MNTEFVARQIVDAAFQVHRSLGPGLLESVYQACLTAEIKSRNIPVEPEVMLPIIYKGQQLEQGFRLDLVVDQQIAIELKSVKELLPVHKAQLITYLRLSNYHLGFLINFNVPRIKDDIQRVVNSY